MRLEGDGWSGFFWSPTPVEGDGVVDGQPFYFRARWETWWLAVAEPGQDPMDIYTERLSGWIYDEDWPGGPFAAGYMTMDEVRQCMERGVAKFRQSKGQGIKP